VLSRAHDRFGRVVRRKKSCEYERGFPVQGEIGYVTEYEMVLICNYFWINGVRLHV
jgi:hypothetical protein